MSNVAYNRPTLSVWQCCACLDSTGFVHVLNVCNLIASRCMAATCGLSRVIHKTRHFHWWNVFDDTCRIGRWTALIISVLIWRQSTLLNKDFRSQWPWPLTFRPNICFPSYSSPALCFTKFEIISSAFLFRKKRRRMTDGVTDGQRDGRTDRQTDRYNA